MARLSFLAALVGLVEGGNAGFVPLVDKKFTWDKLPYRIDTDVGLPRGEQVGYNQCNATTEGPTSLCQTSFINSLDDFCLWAPPSPGKTVGEIEGEMIAWCTQPGHGTRVIPDGALTGVQFVKSPDYVQVVGFIDQTKINMVAGDAGGEMDPHGADLRGNPMGGIIFSNAFTGTYVQVVEWHNFMGGNQFCLKACDPRGANDAKFCQHIYDTQGCGFNAPSNARDTVFESCASDDQPFPGEGVAVPASSLCSTFASTDIYGPTGTVQVPIPGASTISFSPIPKPTKSTSTTAAPTSTASTSGSSSGASTPSATGSNAAQLGIAPSFAVSALAAIFGITLYV
ncbi:glycoprotein [Ephemerocybe angulata]|uniref:Glycoprotein n=1 Tax=Ephemerocybe angulata TaxID=980116 RepID=A0A8H6MED0_9AGAR|nr:glycoprotein [Tulosesus angulatus]